MARHLDNAKSVQAQLVELKDLETKLKILKDELKTYMDENDMDVLNGDTLCYNRVWVKDTIIFDSTKFKEEHADLYAEYKTKEKAGYYRYEIGVAK